MCVCVCLQERGNREVRVRGCAGMLACVGMHACVCVCVCVCVRVLNVNICIRLNKNNIPRRNWRPVREEREKNLKN